MHSILFGKSTLHYSATKVVLYIIHLAIHLLRLARKCIFHLEFTLVIGQRNHPKCVEIVFSSIRNVKRYAERSFHRLPAWHKLAYAIIREIFFEIFLILTLKRYFYIFLMRKFDTSLTYNCNFDISRNRLFALGHLEETLQKINRHELIASGTEGNWSVSFDHKDSSKLG